MQNFHQQSRVWIYLSDRAFTDVEVSDLSMALKFFCEEWSAHGTNLKAAGEIRYSRFIILMVDETAAGASGCSIDKSVHFIQEIEKEYGVQLFNRLLVAWKKEREVLVAPLQELQQLFDDGIIDGDTLIFNNTINSKKELDGKWLMPLRESWMYSRINAKFQNKVDKSNG
ncbi:MAG: hypothetical protein ABIO46_12515 [Chitinophagales bacterium]